MCERVSERAPSLPRENPLDSFSGSSFFSFSSAYGLLCFRWVLMICFFLLLCVWVCLNLLIFASLLHVFSGIGFVFVVSGMGFNVLMIFACFLYGT